MVNDDKIGAARDAEPPLDSVMLGLEEDMGDVVDVRPARYLREMRDHGSAVLASKNSGMPQADLEEHCRVDPTFDLCVIESYLEFIEEAMITETYKRLGRIRASAHNALQARHPGIFNNLEETNHA